MLVLMVLSVIEAEKLRNESYWAFLIELWEKLFLNHFVSTWLNFGLKIFEQLFPKNLKPILNKNEGGHQAQYLVFKKYNVSTKL